MMENCSGVTKRKEDLYLSVYISIYLSIPISIFIATYLIYLKVNRMVEEWLNNFQ